MSTCLWYQRQSKCNVEIRPSFPVVEVYGSEEDFVVHIRDRSGENQGLVVHIYDVGEQHEVNIQKIVEEAN